MAQSSKTSFQVHHSIEIQVRAFDDAGHAFTFDASNPRVYDLMKLQATAEIGVVQLNEMSALFLSRKVSGFCNYVFSVKPPPLVMF